MFDTGLEWLRQATPSPASLTSETLIDVTGELHQLEAVVAERKLAFIAELAGRRCAEYSDTAVGWDVAGEEVAESEISAALTMGRFQAGKLMDLGRALRDRLPRVRVALAAGQLDVYRAGLIEAATRNVDAPLIGEVERQALDAVLAPPGPAGTGLTGRRLTNAVNRIVGHLDPAGVRERRRRARNDRHVGVSPAEDAMATLWGKLPAEDGRKFDGRLRELAGTVCPHDVRSLDQRKADAVGALVDGLSYLPCACGRDDCTQNPTGPADAAPDTRSGRVDVVARKPLVHVIMLASTLHGTDEQPAYLDGYGLIDAEHARNLAADGDVQSVRVPDDVHAERADHAAAAAPTDTTDDPAAVSLPDSAYIYRPSAVLDTWIRILGGTCQWLHCDAPAWNADLDHSTPFDHKHPAAGGPTTAEGMKPYCRRHHLIKHSGTWRERCNRDRSIDLFAPTGHRYRARSPGYLDLLGINPDTIVDDRQRTRRRRTRAENKATRIRAERRQRQAGIDAQRARRTGPIPRDRGTGDDEPCPF